MNWPSPGNYAKVSIGREGRWGEGRRTEGVDGVWYRVKLGAVEGGSGHDGVEEELVEYGGGERGMRSRESDPERIGGKIGIV